MAEPDLCTKTDKQDPNSLAEDDYCEDLFEIFVI
jgi:hypothetical protein